MPLSWWVPPPMTASAPASIAAWQNSMKYGAGSSTFLWRIVCECARMTTASADFLAAEISAAMRFKSFALQADVRPGLSDTLNTSLPIWHVPGASGGVKPVRMSNSRLPLIPVSDAISFTHSNCWAVTRYVSFHRRWFSPGRPGEREVFQPAIPSGLNEADTEMNAIFPLGVSITAAFEASCRFSPMPANGLPASRSVFIVMKSASMPKSSEWLFAQPQPLKPYFQRSGKTEGSIEAHVPPLHAAGRHVPSLTTASKLTSRASPESIQFLSAGATEYSAGNACTMNASPAAVTVTFGGAARATQESGSARNATRYFSISSSVAGSCHSSSPWALPPFVPMMATGTPQVTKQRASVAASMRSRGTSRPSPADIALRRPRMSGASGSLLQGGE